MGAWKLTNLPWMVDSRHLATRSYLDRVDLINDLFANAHGIVLLQGIRLRGAESGNRQPHRKSRLGFLREPAWVKQACWRKPSGGFRPFPSEGGHGGFRADERDPD